MRAVLVLLAGLLAVAAAEKRVVCYFGSWAVYRHGNGEIKISDIDPTLCTHLIYSFVGINPDGSIRVQDAWADLPDGGGLNGYALFNQLRKLSPGTKTMVAIGGWNEGTAGFSQVAANPETRRRFADNVVEFVKRHGFDGFDVDWEYPEVGDKRNFVSLLRELRQRFDQEGLELSAAVGATQSRVSQSYDVPKIAKYLDFINLMTYDLHGPWESQTGIVAPLRAHSRDADRLLNVEAVVNFWLEQGAPADKLVLGVPTYGQGFTLASPSSNDIGAPVAGKSNQGPYTGQAGMLGYNEICEKILSENWNVVFHEEQRVPYAFSDNQWVGFDNEQSIKEKAELANQLGLGGMMVWSLETDDFKGVCGEKYPLLKTINREYRGDASSSRPSQRPKPTRPSQRPKPSRPATQAPQASYNEPEPTQPPAPPAATGSLCSAEGYVRDPQNCGVFYYCQPFNGQFVPHTMTCPASLVYNLESRLCDYPHNVRC